MKSHYSSAERRRHWTPEEDLQLKKCVEKHGEGNWHLVPSRAGIKRCRKSCRLRWLNYLCPSIKRGEFTDEEDDLIFRLHKLLGNRWSLIAGRISGRTANDVKNHWNSHLRKKLVYSDETKKAIHEKVEVIKPQPRIPPKNLQIFANKHPLENEVSMLMIPPGVTDMPVKCWDSLLLSNEEEENIVPGDTDNKVKQSPFGNSSWFDGMELVSQAEGALKTESPDWEVLITSDKDFYHSDWSSPAYHKFAMKNVFGCLTAITTKQKDSSDKSGKVTQSISMFSTSAVVAQMDCVLSASYLFRCLEREKGLKAFQKQCASSFLAPSSSVIFLVWSDSKHQTANMGEEGGERDLEKGLSHSGEPLPSPYPSPTALASVSASAPALVLSNSGKRIDQAGKKKYVKQVTGRHNDTELHLAAQRGDLIAVKQLLANIDSQMLGTTSGADVAAEVAEIRSCLVNELNELEETALFTAADKGHLDVVKELLKYSTKECISRRNRSGFDPLHIAALQGHHAVVQVLLERDPGLARTFGPSNSTPLISAAHRGHTEVVNELLLKDSSLLENSRSNGKNALHLAARQGHVKVVKALLAKDPQLARRTDKKGQTALHMAVKGQSCEVVILLLEADAAIVMLPDKFGNTALHVATRKKRAEIVNQLLLLPDTNVNALTRDHKTAFDIAEGLPLSEESAEIKECLARYGAVRANELNQPRDELRKTVTEIKKDVHTQLEQTRKTNKNVHGIAKELRKLHREGINNATNSVTVVAVLFATVAFAAIFTVPGGDGDDGVAVTVSTPSFKIFFLFNAVALFTSLAVVLVQITLVRGETRSERKVVKVINKLMWLASVCTSVAFIASSYIVVGRHNQWAAILVTVIGGVIMAGVLGTMTYYVMKFKRSRSIRKREKYSKRSESNSLYHSELSDSEVNPIYAI
ncbi:hypothetical protein NE237_004251 [Protea cynaroides]|uniref:Ankyrin repeat-containing protein n=1 Tax=Protea cynaroides TaxID=273540 RepID=A0A9Q0KIF6_9MAGN|nr:hypothetical protein NE237_004251 [Protea cynaroides]